MCTVKAECINSVAMFVLQVPLRLSYTGDVLTQKYVLKCDL